MTHTFILDLPAAAGIVPSARRVPMQPYRRSQFSTSQRLGLVLLVAITYVLTGRAGLSMYITEVGATLVWAPTGISIAAVYLLGSWIWPGIWLGSLLTNLAVSASPAAAMIATGNTCEALLAVWLVRRWTQAETPFDHIRDVLGYLILACMVATAVSASVGSATLQAAGLLSPGSIAEVWQLWWLGDLMGALLLAPILILLVMRHTGMPDTLAPRPLPRRLMETLLTLASGLLLVWLVYSDVLDPDYRTRLTYLPIIPMLWAALRLSRLNALAQSLALSALAISLTLLHGLNEGKQAANQNLMLLYLFLFVQNAAILLVAAVVQERNRMDADLARARREAEEASAQKGRFLTNMSHEIRTPLNGILGVTAMLLPEMEQPRHREQLRIIQSSADSLLSILNDVLDHARIEAGKLEIEPRPFNLPQLVRDVCGLFESQAESRGLSLRARISNDVPRYVVNDDTRVRQILVNLVSNAVKFTPRGSIEVSVSVASQGPPPVVQFVVRDTGIGIPGEAMKSIFSAFTQADSSTSRLYGGSGLGLTICKQLAEHLGGELQLVSLEGVGTEVTVTLPLPLANQDQVGDLTGESRISTGDTGKMNALLLGKRILVAEDNSINAQVTEQMLRRLGYEVAVATDGEQALAQWQQGFDLILMDCHMPRMDGYETTRAIRKLEKEGHRHIPIVALTANAMKDERDRCISAGMDDYLAKPIRLTQLDSTLKRHLQAL